MRGIPHTCLNLSQQFFYHPLCEVDMVGETYCMEIEIDLVNLIIGHLSPYFNTICGYYLLNGMWETHLQKILKLSRKA